MKYVDYIRIKQDTKEFPDNEVFTVYTTPKQGYFTKTEEPVQLWAFAIKVKDKFTLSDWKRSDVSKEEVQKSLKQVLFAGINGWSNTGEKKVNEYLETVDQYECLYCGAHTLEVEGPCSCRMYKTTESGIIAPLEGL